MAGCHLGTGSVWFVWVVTSAAEVQPQLGGDLPLESLVIAHLTQCLPTRLQL